MLCDLHILVCNGYNREEKGLLATFSSSFCIISYHLQVLYLLLLIHIALFLFLMSLYLLFVPLFSKCIIAILSLSLYVPPRFANT